MRKVLFSFVVALSASATAGVKPVVDPLSAIEGDWEIVDTATGNVVQNCTKAQSFRVTPERTHVALTERHLPNGSARYIVLHAEQNRVLMFIENEHRRTKGGDPILWWAVFIGPDAFYWRQYDWGRGQRTITWKRCR
jgi:hypothetical protein